ncbi:unannotated protein [freshwater metagenome]|uniref:Unannotated protein n=1 Tax=freshwater metagenome TaxID=449393 RepID=A0A6J6QZ65_9ZZZZ
MAMFTWPPRESLASNSVTVCPFSAKVRAASNPPGPPPMTATFLALAAGSISCGNSNSRPVEGL